MSIPSVSLAGLPWFDACLNDAAEGFAALYQRFRPRRSLLLVEDGDGSFSGADGACRLTAEGWRLARPDQLRGAHIEFRIQPHRCIQREIELPARAREFVDGIVRAQIDRLTPWRADEAAFACAPPTPRGADRIAVAVIATKRATLAGLLDIPADTISVTVAPEGGSAIVTLMTRRTGAARRLQRWRTALVVSLGASLLAAVAALAAEWTLLADVNARADSLAADLAGHRAALMRRERAGDDPTAQVLEARKRANPAAVVVLEALTRALPDDAYLTNLKIAGNRIEITGLARDAAALVPDLERSPHFSHATFTAPTTRAEAREAFRIEARVAPMNSIALNDRAPR